MEIRLVHWHRWWIRGVQSLEGATLLNAVWLGQVYDRIGRTEKIWNGYVQRGERDVGCCHGGCIVCQNDAQREGLRKWIISSGLLEPSRDIRGSKREGSCTVWYNWRTLGIRNCSLGPRWYTLGVQEATGAETHTINHDLRKEDLAIKTKEYKRCERNKKKLTIHEVTMCLPSDRYQRVYGISNSPRYYALFK